MIIPIEDLRKRIGLEPDDPSKDTEITEAWTVAWAISESYLNRRLDYEATWLEVFTHFEGYVISLERYPVCAIETIVPVDGGTFKYHLESLTGLIHVDGRIKQHGFTITYSGGYHEDTAGDPCPYIFPADLMVAIKQIFDGIYADQEAGAPGLSSENIQSITINDVGTIRWGGSGAGGAGGAGSIGYIPSTSVAIMSPYKRELC